MCALRQRIAPGARATSTIETSQWAATIQAGIQCAACIEDDLAMRMSNQSQRFKKPNLNVQKKATQSPQSEDPYQEVESDEDVDQTVNEETLVNGESDC